MPLNTSDICVSTRWLTNVVEINRRIKEALEREAGLSVSQYRILLELSVNGDHLTCGALATLLFLSPAAVTHAVDYLYHHGLVTRTVMESNRRVTLVNITDAGAKKLHGADEALVAMLRRDAWSRLDPEQLSMLVSSCSAAVGPFVGRTLVHDNVPMEPCYITCAIIQQQCYEDLLGEYNLTLNEFRIGVCVLGATAQGLRSSDLSEMLLINRSSTSRAVVGLKKKGVLESTVCKNDSRASNLTLTPLGRKTISEAFDRMAVLDNSICVNTRTLVAPKQNDLSDLVHASLAASALRDRE